MRIELNGQQIELADGASVTDAVEAAGVSEARMPSGDEARAVAADWKEAAGARRAGRRGVAVAVDGEVVPRGEWDGTSIQEGQVVEVVHAIQGG